MTDEQVQQTVLNFCTKQLAEMTVNQVECTIGTIVSYFIYKKSQIQDRPANAVMVEFIDRVIDSVEDMVIPALAGGLDP